MRIDQKEKKYSKRVGSEKSRPECVTKSDSGNRPPSVRKSSTCRPTGGRKVDVPTEGRRKPSAFRTFKNTDLQLPAFHPLCSCCMWTYIPLVHNTYVLHSRTQLALLVRCLCKGGKADCSSQHAIGHSPPLLWPDTAHQSARSKLILVPRVEFRSVLSKAHKAVQSDPNAIGTFCSRCSSGSVRAHAHPTHSTWCTVARASSLKS